MKELFTYTFLVRDNFRLCACAFLFAFTFSLSSQTWQWARSENIEATGRAICNDSQGNVFLTGFSWSPGNIGTTTFTADGNAFVAKYDASGTLLWSRGFSFTSFNHGQCNGVACDNAGNVFISGTFGGTMVVGTNTFVAFTAPNGGVYFDMFLVKYDANGNLLWAKVLGGDYGGESGYSLVTDPGGNVFVAGQFSTYTLAVGQSTISSYSYGNYFIAKYSSNGTPLWAVAPPLNVGSSVAYNLVRDGNGNLIICGSYQYSLTGGSTTLTSSSNNDYNYFVAKYDSLGAFQWLRGGGDTQTEIAFDVDADPSGNVYLTGGFYNPKLVVGTFTLTSAGSADAFITKYDPAGNIIWSKNIGSPGMEVGRAVKAHNGGFFLAGSLAPFGTCTLVIGTTAIVPKTIAARWLAQFDGSGNPTGYVSYDQGTGNQGMIFNPLAMTIDQGCNLYLGGAVQYQAIIGNDTIEDVGNSSPFVAKLQLPTSNTVVVNIAGNTPLCSGSSATLSASGATNYKWIGGPSSNVYVVSPLTTTSYTVSGNSACDVDSAVVTVIVNPTPTLFIAASQPTYCSGSVAQLTVSGANNYTWSTGSQVSTATFVTAGTTTLTVSGNNTAGNCSSTRSLVVNVVVCTGFEGLQSAGLRVYPNPSREKLMVESDGASFFNLILKDALGREVLKQNSSDNKSTLDLIGLPNGVYYLSITENNAVRMVKVIKE
jgi:hypothetical protein